MLTKCKENTKDNIAAEKCPRADERRFTSSQETPEKRPECARHSRRQHETHLVCNARIVRCQNLLRQRVTNETFFNKPLLHLSYHGGYRKEKASGVGGGEMRIDAAAAAGDWSLLTTFAAKQQIRIQFLVVLLGFHQLTLRMRN